MGIELEFMVLLAIAIVGPARFAVFEIETPWWRKVLKWSVITLLTVGLYRLVGHWALLFPATSVLLGITVHFWWCGRHGIDPYRAVPRRRYYQLRGWTWPDE